MHATNSLGPEVNNADDILDISNTTILDASRFPDVSNGHGQNISKQYLTDGHERSVHFNYRVTLSDNVLKKIEDKEKSKPKDEVDETFMI
jgi:hypothetical protein